MQVYKTRIEWTGNSGSGTFDYRSYERSHTITIEGKERILGSSDSIFLGDHTRHNPEDLFVSAIASCHMLWYLHLCARESVIVMQYTDEAVGEMVLHPDGSGFFKRIVLNPKVIVTEPGMVEEAGRLHDDARKMCFLANSCNFEVEHHAETTVLQ